jgi:hypothetical protein
MADPSTSLRTGIDIVRETAAMKPLRPVDGELRRPPRRKEGQKAAPAAEAEAVGESRPPEADEPLHSVDTYA